MKYAGDQKNRRERTDLIMRIAGIIFPLLFVIQGYLVGIGVIRSERYISNEVFIASSALFLGIAIYCSLTPAKSKLNLYIRTWGMDFSGLLITLVTTGFATPLALGLVLMIYDAYRLLGLRGMMGASIMLAIAVMIDMYRAVESASSSAIYIIISVTGAVVISYILMMILHVQSVRQSALEKSRAQADLERDRIATLVNNLSEGVINVDTHGIVRMYNAAALNILDTNDSLNGHHIDEVLHIKNEDGRRVEIFSILKKSHVSFTRDDFYYHYSDDTIRLEISATPVRSANGGKRRRTEGGYLLLLRDVTKQKSLDEERDEFISVVSHELRTPLTIMEGSLGNLELMYQKGLTSNDRVKPTLRAAHDQVLFLSKMVNDLSTLSRAERGVADTPEDIDIAEMLKALYDEYEPQARANKLALNLDTSQKLGTIHVSRLYVTELLQNFITNAIKYTKKGTVTICAKVKEDTITFSVKDTGIGISKSDQKKIYEKFYRSEDYRTRETRGTGLGLYVSTKLARKLNTQISLKSRLDYGSEFSFSLPLKSK